MTSSLASIWIVIGRWPGCSRDQLPDVLQAVDEGGAGRAVVDLLHVEDLEAGAGERGVDRIEAEQRHQLRVRVAATGGIVDEHVELDLAHAGVELVGQGPVRVLEPVGCGPEDGTQHGQERRLGLDVVAVVRRQDLDLVDGDLGPPAVAAGAAAHGDRAAGGGQQAHERQGGEEEDEARLAADHSGSLSGRRTVPPVRRSPTGHLPVILALRHVIVC